MYRPVVYIRQSQLTSAADQAQHVQDWDNVTPGHCVSRDTNIIIFYQYLTPLVTLVTTPAHVGLSSLLSSFPQDVSVMLKLFLILDSVINLCDDVSDVLISLSPVISASRTLLYLI